MIAPKINGQSMREVYWDYEDNCGSWIASFNSGMLEIRVFKNRTGDCTYRITYDTILINSYGGTAYSQAGLNTPQAAADEAAKWLARLCNLLNDVFDNNT